MSGLVQSILVPYASHQKSPSIKDPIILYSGFTVFRSVRWFMSSYPWWIYILNTILEYVNIKRIFVDQITWKWSMQSIGIIWTIKCQYKTRRSIWRKPDLIEETPETSLCGSNHVTSFFSWFCLYLGRVLLSINT